MSRIALLVALAVSIGLPAAWSQERGRSSDPSRPQPGPSGRFSSYASPARPVPLSAPEKPAEARAPAVPPKPEPLGDLLRAAERPSVAWQKRTVIRLSHAPAVDVAKAINALFQGDPAVTIVPEPVSNSLLIGALPNVLEEVLAHVKQLDQRRNMVALEVVIVQVKATGPQPESAARPSPLGEQSIDAQLRALENRGKVEVLTRPRLMTLDNQSAFIQVSRREPRITSQSSGSFGKSNTLTMENVGTLVSITPRVSDQAVVMEINIEQSRLGPEEEGVPITIPVSGEPIRSPRIETFTAKSTLCLADGRAVSAAGMVSESKQGRTELVVLLSARIVDGPGK